MENLDNLLNEWARRTREEQTAQNACTDADIIQSVRGRVEAVEHDLTMRKLEQEKRDIFYWMDEQTNGQTFSATDYENMAWRELTRGVRN